MLQFVAAKSLIFEPPKVFLQCYSMWYSLGTFLKNKIFLKIFYGCFGIENALRVQLGATKRASKENNSYYKGEELARFVLYKNIVIVKEYGVRSMDRAG